MHLTDFLDQNAQKHAAKPALVCEDRQLTWSELAQEVDRAANSLFTKLGRQESQSVVGLLLPNSWQFVVCYLAILKLGHIALPLDPAYKNLELGAIVKQIPSSLIITDESYISNIDSSEQATLLADDLLQEKGGRAEQLRFDPTDQIASLTFTSGTTGTPKAVPNTHANHVWNIEACSKVWQWTSDDTLLVAVPLSHMLGIVMGLSGVLYHGNTMYLQRWFDETAVLEALSTGKISFFSHAASAYVKLVQAPDKGYDLSGVRLCVSGAAPLPPPVWQEFKKRYGIEIAETYGTSETGRIAANRLDERVLGSPGRPLPGVDLRLSSEGEVQVKSGGVFPGYYNNSKATAAASTSDGYWRTGDIAELREGYVYLKGRVQELIRRYGYTVSPRDVEWAMHKHPGIKDIYVMGRQVPVQPDDELVYFIVSNLNDDEIRQYCKDNLLFAWRPDKIIRLKELPRTRSGKPRMNDLKKMAGASA